MTTDTRPSSRERLLDATVTLMRTKGAAASGTAEILQLAQAPRGSFYFHFPGGKDQLVLEALARAAAATLTGLVEALADDRVDLADQIRALFAAIADELVTGEYAPGCAVAVTTVESASVSEPFQQAVAAAFETWTSALTDRLVARGVDPAAAVALADAVVAATEGATVLARARRSPLPLQHAGEVLALAVTAMAGD